MIWNHWFRLIAVCCSRSTTNWRHFPVRLTAVFFFPPLPQALKISKHIAKLKFTLLNTFNYKNNHHHNSSTNTTTAEDHSSPDHSSPNHSSPEHSPTDHSSIDHSTVADRQPDRSCFATKKMNEKNLLIDEYIDVNDKQFLQNVDKLGENFAPKCNLTGDGDDLVEGDDEQTDEDGQQLNSNGQQISGQRRRRKSSGKSKLNKIMQSSLSSTNTAGHPEPQSEDPPQSSCSSLSSEWIHLDHQNHALNQVNKNLKQQHNLTSSCDTISEDEHRKNKRNQRSIAIDDDIVSSSNDDVDGHFFGSDGKAGNGKSTSTKLDNKPGSSSSSSNKLVTKSKQSMASCDSLSSSPTNHNHSDDSSSPIKPPAASSNLSASNLSASNLSASNSSAANNKLMNGNQISQNKENHLFTSNNVSLDKRQSTASSVMQAPPPPHSSLVAQSNGYKPVAGKMSGGGSSSSNSNFHQFGQPPAYHHHHQCLNCHHNNNYITTLEEPDTIPWLYNIHREEAERFLQKFINFDGLFLVRVSSKNASNFVLSFVHDTKIKHCNIRKIIDSDESTICFSIDDGKTKFYDLKQLIEFYQLNAYFLPCKLKYFLVHK